MTNGGALGTGTVTIGTGGTNELARLQLSNNISLGGVTTYNLAGMTQSTAATNARIENLSGNNSISGNINFANTGGSFVNIISTAGTLTLGGNLSATTVTGVRNFEFAGAGNITSDGVISNGSATVGVVKEGTGTLTLTGNNSYTGNTTVNSGIINVQSNNGLSTSGTVSAINRAAGIQLQGGITIPSGVSFLTSNDGDVGAGATVPYAIDNVSGNNTINGAINMTIGGGNTVIQSDSGALTLAGATSIASGVGDRTLILQGASTGANTVSGVISNGNAGTTSVTKTGTGTWTLSGAAANTYTGLTTVNGGTLLLAKTAGTNAIAGTVKVGDGTGTDTLALGASDQIANSSAMELAGGVFSAGAGFNEGSGATVSGGTSTAGIASLTLSANSTLDFNGGGGEFSTLVFGTFAPTGTLTINNWTGLPFQGGSTLGDNNGSDRLIFASDQTFNLSSFSFTGFAPGATQITLADNSYEIVPIPEPTALVGALALLGLIGWRESRRPTEPRECRHTRPIS